MVKATHEVINFNYLSALRPISQQYTENVEKSTAWFLMAPSDDLKAHAASSHDFYALLDISPAAADTEIRRAYRRTALKYHPDKLQDPKPADIEKFHLLQIAYDVLSDPSIRQLYDNAREARERKKRENEMLEGVRRKMKEDLEARERGVKRPFGATGLGRPVDLDDAEAQLEEKIRRLAEDGRRRRQQKEELMRREVLEEEERREQEREERERAALKEREGQSSVGGTAVPEIERAVKIRWIREEQGLDLDKERLEKMFSAFGNVESVIILKDKKKRVGERREKKTIGTGIIVFSSIVGAHAAVEDSKKQPGSDWDTVESVFWASNKEPDLESYRAPSSASNPQPESPSKPRSAPKPRSFNFPGLNTPAATIGSGTGKAPSFASFSSAANVSSTTKANLGPNSPSFEEITLMRLKNAQRKRLEEQLKKEDEEAAAVEPENDIRKSVKPSDDRTITVPKDYFTAELPPPFAQPCL
ncbi:predicted protein [Uncinocarpus reesii 1704]|uniref:J domain-containing protein n=1 Tax=Uncinocarpus reesii (strain UAMH 1704) TaxID=336963 RepID=C4JV24_UNCRE|nr:uncharacterized protein UREG_04977 [Uncinocarpus reesii 1704]EEP80135.1 predicted protein [Uncinocarpus reesii 1704]